MLGIELEEILARLLETVNQLDSETQETEVLLRKLDAVTSELLRSELLRVVELPLAAKRFEKAVLRHDELLLELRTLEERLKITDVTPPAAR